MGYHRWSSLIIVPSLCPRSLNNSIAPYHPYSNGESGWLMETFKQSIDKANPKTASQLQDAVIEFLAKYRSTPHTATNSSSSELLNNRRLQTILDLLYPCETDTAKSKEQQKTNYDSHTTTCQSAVWAEISVKLHVGVVLLLLSALVMLCIKYNWNITCKSTLN